MNDWYEQLLSSLATKHDEVCTEGAACSARRKHIESAYVIPALRKMIERVREALFASDDGTEYEHDRDHGQAEGYPDCPGCWVETIRRALDGEVEA